MITVNDLLDFYEDKAAIAEDFDVSRAAVSQWGLDDPIPEKQELKARTVLFPGESWPSDSERLQGLLNSP